MKKILVAIPKQKCTDFNYARIHRIPHLHCVIEVFEMEKKNIITVRTPLLCLLTECLQTKPMENRRQS